MVFDKERRASSWVNSFFCLLFPVLSPLDPGRGSWIPGPDVCRLKVMMIATSVDQSNRQSGQGLAKAFLFINPQLCFANLWGHLLGDYLYLWGF